MRPFVIRLVQLANGHPSSFDGEYVLDYNPAARAGLGEVITTPDPLKAKRYPTREEAWEEYRRVAPEPFHERKDGQPNRPLTAYTVMLEQLPEALP